MSGKKPTTAPAAAAKPKEAPKKADAPAKEAPKKADAPAKEAPKKAEAPKEAPKKAETPKEAPKKKEESKPAAQPAAPAAATQPAAAAPAKKGDKKGEKKAAPAAKKDDKKAAKKPAQPQAVNNSFLKPGKVVILLHGRQAGHKAVIVRALRADKTRHFPTILVAGIERYPLKVTRKMGVRKVAHRSQVKPFLKIVNVAHVMPTRYSMDVDLKPVADVAKSYDDSTKRTKAKQTIRKLFQERYTAGKNRWFFQKLRF